MNFIRQGITQPFIPNVNDGVLEKLLEYSLDIPYEDKSVCGNGIFYIFCINFFSI